MVGAFTAGKKEGGMEDEWSSVLPILSMERLDSLEAILELPEKANSLVSGRKRPLSWIVTKYVPGAVHKDNRRR